MRFRRPDPIALIYLSRVDKPARDARRVLREREEPPPHIPRTTLRAI